MPGSFSKNTLMPAYFVTISQVPGRAVKNNLHHKKLALAFSHLFALRNSIKQ
jgi:hypothetical protein